MDNDETHFPLENEIPSSYPTLTSAIIAVITVLILIWLVSTSIRLTFIGDYSLFLILLVFLSSAVVIVYLILKDEEADELWFGGLQRESNSHRLHDHGFEAHGAGPPTL